VEVEDRDPVHDDFAALAMEFIRRAAQHRSKAEIDPNANRATEVLRVFVLQLEAHDRRRAA